MKAYISESELWPCYGVGLEPGRHDAVVDVPEATIRKWRKILSLFHKTQAEIEQAIKKQEHYKDLQASVAKPNPSRRDKENILRQFGWTQVDTSLWEKDGRQLRLHAAYEECGRELLS